ncbi:MAG: hypothetical protein WAT81_00195 [Candidatus Moraniibacteriota bacterium]
MGHALWRGIRLRPEVDMQFRLDPFANGCRLIRVRLVKPDGSIVTFTTGSSFGMSTLGKDHERLENIGAELVVITRYVSQIEANMESDGGVLLHIRIMDDQQLFRLYAKEPDRSPVDRWDWFVDPNVVYANGVPIHVPRPVNDEPRQQAAA